MDVDHFKSEGIDGAVLLSLDDGALHSLGISVPLDRKVFRAAIDQLLDPAVAAEHDPAILRAHLAEDARLAELHDADTSAIASAKEALEALRSKQAAMHTSNFGRGAVLKPGSVTFTEPDQKLGDGSSGTVLLGTCTFGTQSVDAALKVIRGSLGVHLSDKARKEIMNEVEVRKYRKKISLSFPFSHP